MNSFISLETDYIRSSRTIETVLVSNSHIDKIFFVYNFEGISFRVFSSIINLIKFFETGLEKGLYFENEIDLDNFFSKVELTKNERME